MRKLNTIKTSLNNRRDNYFQLSNSLGHLMKISKRFYVTSIGFDQIFYGTKNPTRYKICVLTCIYCWLVTIGQIVFISCDQIYSKFDGPFLPDNFKTIHVMAVIAFALCSLIKAELLIGEKKYNLKPLRVFYSLMNNWKFSIIKHNLNVKNYKRLALFNKNFTDFFIGLSYTNYNFNGIFNYNSNSIFIWTIVLVSTSHSFDTTLHMDNLWLFNWICHYLCLLFILQNDI